MPITFIIINRNTYEYEYKQLINRTLDRLRRLGKESNYWLKKSEAEEKYGNDKVMIRLIKILHNQIFNEYKEPYGALLDKYNITKSCYRKDACATLSKLGRKVYREFE